MASTKPGQRKRLLLQALEDARLQLRMNQFHDKVELVCAWTRAVPP